MTTKRAKRVFWTKKRIKTALSLPCRDLLLILEDKKGHSAKELSEKTGRTPGALHAPLQQLCAEGIIERSAMETPNSRRGRPAQIFKLNPEASAELMDRTPGAAELKIEADAASLRMFTRTARRNVAKTRKQPSALVNHSTIEYSFLNDREVAQVQRKIMEIQKLLSRRRTDGPNTARHRIRVGLMMVEEPE